MDFSIALTVLVRGVTGGGGGPRSAFLGAGGRRGGGGSEVGGVSSTSTGLLGAFSTLRATTGGIWPVPLGDRSGSQELDTLKTVANAGARQFEEPF